MAEIKLGPVPQIGAPGVRTIPSRQALTSQGTSTQGPSTNGNASAGTVNVSQNATLQALDAGAAPVDFERVSTIRKAIKSGSYPLVPAKIADAMIAASILLRSAPA
jgi:negative regulator of flagellin synthesis FlgM